MYYDAKGAEELFKASSIFQRRIRNGCLKAEVDHPKKTPGMSMDDYFTRILTIDGKNVCAHFKEVWLDPEFGKNHPEYKNPNLIAIMAKVKPSGPYGNSLKDSFENNCENVLFYSIRSITKDEWIRGVLHRTIKNIVTFDMVTEPGIMIADKFDAPALESYADDIIIEPEILNSIINDRQFALESNSLEIATETMKLFSSSWY